MNKVFLIGNLTRDPELRTTASSKSVCSFSIAVNRAFSNQQGEKVTDFFNIIVWESSERIVPNTSQRVERSRSWARFRTAAMKRTA